MKTTVIIAEKPLAAQKIASSLFEKPKRVEKRGAYWFEYQNNNQKFIVIPAVGHLFVLDSKNHDWQYPIFEVEWKPSFLKRSSSFSKKYFENLKEVFKRADNYIIATDYDVEGEVIGYNLVRFLGNNSKVYRMKFSTLTKKELKEAFGNLIEGYDQKLAEAGLARHYLDFYWGVNLTRALTKALKEKQNLFKILSIGRVQGPTLALLAKRELEIKKFKPKKYWQIKAYAIIAAKKFELQYKGKSKFWKKEEAEKIIMEIKSKLGVVKSIKERTQKISPPVPYNTTDLQVDAYRTFGFAPAQTLAIAEALYQMGFISYPRSSSQKLPPTINYKEILQALSKLKPYSKFAEELAQKEKLIPTQGKKDDPAHPAIYPTAEVPELGKLTANQRKLYDLIVRRFLAVFGSEAIRKSITVTIQIGEHKLLLKGSKIVEKGWQKYYEGIMKSKKVEIPKVKEGEEIKIESVQLLEKQTEPPKRYSAGSIIKEMEARGLGTKATRAEILQTLYQRNYIKGKSITVTNLGLAVVKALEKHCPAILSEKLTRKFEEEMENIYNGNKKRQEVIEEAKKVLTKILKEIEKSKTEMAKALAKALRQTWQKEKFLGYCPNCSGELKIIRSKKTKRFFAGCSNYPSCKNSYPLPQKAKIEQTGKVCQHCNTPIVKVYRGKRPFTMCLDPSCKTKQNWNSKK